MQTVAAYSIEAPSRKRHAVLGREGSAEAPSDAFGRLLERSASTISDQIRNTADADASQMFEAKGQGAGQGRRVEGGPAKLDVEQADPVEPGATTPQPTRLLRDTNARARAVGRGPAQPGGDFSHSGSLNVASAQGASSLEAKGAPVRPGPSSTAGNRGPAAAELPRTVTVNPSRESGVAPQAPMAVAVAATPTSDASSEVARRIGQVLVASRSEGVESARPVSVNISGLPSRPANAGSKPADGRATKPETEEPGGPISSKTAPPERERAEFDQMVRSIRLQMGGRRSTARLRLEPPELGRVRIDVRVDGDAVRVDVQAETEAARHRLVDRAEMLKAGLAEHGIRVERFEVAVDAPSDGGERGSASFWSSSPEGQHRGSHEAQSDDGAQGGNRDVAEGTRAAKRWRTDVIVDQRLDIRV